MHTRREDRLPGRPAGRCPRRRWAAGIAAGALAVVSLTACAGGGAGATSSLDRGAPESKPAEGGVAAGGGGAGVVDTDSGGTSLLPADRYVIATASRQIRVDDVVLTLPRLSVIAQANNGFIASEDSSTDPTDPTRMSAVVVLRVPTPRLSQALSALGELGQVLSRQENVQDVTEVVADVDSRVASARASVVRIRLLLARAQSIADIVRIESELAQREADLESLQAQQRSLHDQTDYATITVSLTGAGTPAQSDPDTGFLVGLQKGWDALAAAFGWLLTVVGLLLPFLVLLGVLALPFLAVWRRRRAATTPGPSTVPGPDDREDARV